MKALIWIGCIFGMAVIQTVIASAGVQLGALPMVILFLVGTESANSLCKKWDKARAKKD